MLMFERPDWNEYFMLQAKLAACRSTCNSRPQGAVLVRNCRVIATGYNGALPGQEHCSDHATEEFECPECSGNTMIWDKTREPPFDVKACPTCQGRGTIYSSYCHRRYSGTPDSQKDRACVSSHAEANAIAQAARLGIATEGAILYCTTRPCIPCTKLLVQAGIVKVFYELDYDDPVASWLDDVLSIEQLTIRLEIIKLAIEMLRHDTSRRRLARTE